MPPPSTLSLTVEISLYPLSDDYLPAIRTFIAWLNAETDLVVSTTPTATLVHGEYDRVFEVIATLVKRAREQFGNVVFMTKLIPGHTLD